MQDHFTTKLNELLAGAEEDSRPTPRMSAEVERALAGRSERDHPTNRAAPGNCSAYGDWTISSPDDAIRSTFAEARRLIASCNGDYRALVKLRRAISKRIHPDLVPQKFVGDAEEIMKNLNARITSAPKEA